MPVIRQVPQDPTDLVIQGEQMRQSVDDYDTPAIDALMQGASVDTDWMSSQMTTLADQWPPMNSMVEIDRIAVRRQKGGILQIRANAGVSTPCGAWIWREYGVNLEPVLWASVRWLLSGVTRDSAGSALGGCRVVVLDVGLLAVGSAQAVMAETVSDGSGNYSVEVPENTAYQVISYLTGAPDRAGISVNTLTPTAA